MKTAFRFREEEDCEDYGHHSNVSFKIVVSQTYESWLITAQEYENLMGPLAHMSNLVQCVALEASCYVQQNYENIV